MHTADTRLQGEVARRIWQEVICLWFGKCGQASKEVGAKGFSTLDEAFAAAPGSLLTLHLEFTKHSALLHWGLAVVVIK